MEATIQKSQSQSKSKAVVATIAILSALVLVATLVSHISITIITREIFDFAIHHYFLIIFISLTILIVSIKLYISLNQKIDRNYRERHSIELSKDRRKRIRILNFFKRGKKSNDELVSKFVKTDEVIALKFLKTDVLQDEGDIIQRQRDLQKATVMGNSYKHKVIILFKDCIGKKHLLTTIWQSTNDHVSLKGGITLPVKCIYKIEF